MPIPFSDVARPDVTVPSQLAETSYHSMDGKDTAVCSILLLTSDVLSSILPGQIAYHTELLC